LCTQFIYGEEIDWEILKTLGLGSKFIPTPNVNFNNILKIAFKETAKSIRTRTFFKEEIPEKSKLYVKNSQWYPPNRDIDVECFLIQLKNNLSELSKNTNYNLNKRRNIKYKDLRKVHKFSKNLKFIIRPADKNLGLVILKRDFYEKLVLEHLENKEFYNELLEDNINDFKNKMTSDFQKIKQIK